MPQAASGQDAPLRQALLVAEGLGHLGATLRAYAQLGHQVAPADGAGLLSQARGEFDASLAKLLRRGTRQMTAAEIERLRQRWRSVRDATYTRPSPEIGALMADIGEDIAGQLRGLLPAPVAARGARFERAWQRQSLQWLAMEGLFGCWRDDLGRWAQMEQLRSDFSRWLAAQEESLSQVTWVQYNSQWNLLTTSLPRAGSHGCTRQSMRSLVETTDRLIGMIASLP